MSERPLSGIRVLDLSRLLPGPFLTMVLGDMGADVVKIEAPNVGDYMRQMPPHKGGMNGGFLAVNRNKRSVVLDLKQPAARDALLRMVEQADVVVETFRPGVMDKLGVGYEALRARNPGIVVCSISGYGQTGPYRDRAGHDLNYIGLAGVLAMGGVRDGKPTLPGVQIADVAGGALWGAVAVLGALVGRGRTGEGAHLDISMCEGSLAMLAHMFGYLDAGAPAMTRAASTLNGGLCNYDTYETSDGKWIAVGSLEPKFYLALNAALGRRGEIADVIKGPAQQDEMRAEIAGIFKTKTRDEWIEILARHDACCEPVLEMHEVLDHPLHKERGVFFTIDDPDIGSSLQVKTPVGPASASRRAPKLGEHSREVLTEYGFTPAEIDALS